MLKYLGRSENKGAKQITGTPQDCTVGNTGPQGALPKTQKGGDSTDTGTTLSSLAAAAESEDDAEKGPDGHQLDQGATGPSLVSDQAPETPPVLPEDRSTSEDTPEVKRLDSDVYRPWGRRSTNQSPDGGQANSKTVCKGGPGKPRCDKEVGVESVECDKCLNWFHIKCQGISKAALNVLSKWHGTLLWLCHKCVGSLREDPGTTHSSAKLEDSVAKLEEIARQSANLLKETIQNQEKMYAGQCKLFEKLASETTNEETHKKTYAEVIKGVGAEVAERVTKSIDRMPAVSIPVQRSNEEIAILFDEMQDKEKRKLNVVVHNLKEGMGQSHAERGQRDSEMFEKMVRDGLKLTAHTSRTFRVGRQEGDKPRLLVVTLSSMTEKIEILKSAASLRDTDWGNIYITPDLTWKEREKARQLRSELARRREAGEMHIVIRHGQIVTVPEAKRQQQSRGPTLERRRGPQHPAPLQESTANQETPDRAEGTSNQSHRASQEPGLPQAAGAPPVSENEEETRGNAQPERHPTRAPEGGQRPDTYSGPQQPEEAPRH